MKTIYRDILKLSALALMFSMTTVGLRLPQAQAQAAAKKPNIVII